MPPRKRISALGTIVLTIFYIGFMIYTSVMRGSDTNFQRCFPADRVLFPLTVVSSVAIVIPIVSSSKPKTFYMYRMSTWLVYLLFSTSVVIFHYVQLIYIMRAFRGPTGRMNPELEFGFGQLLIFFMILQLFVEFGMGLWCQLPTFFGLESYVNDLQRIWITCIKLCPRPIAVCLARSSSSARFSFRCSRENCVRRYCRCGTVDRRS